MILGEFTWRGFPVEVESAPSPAGEVVWLHQLGAERVGIGMVTGGQLRLTRHAPRDNMAAIELEAAYRDFREAA